MRATLTEQELAEILGGWRRALTRLPDSERSMSYLYSILRDPESAWFYGTVPGSYIYLRDIHPGEYAGFHALNPHGESALQDIQAARRYIGTIMDEYELIRLYSLIPVPIFRVHRALKKLGFKQEGRLRKAVKFNGDFTDMYVMGLLRVELC